MGQGPRNAGKALLYPSGSSPSLMAACLFGRPDGNSATVAPALTLFWDPKPPLLLYTTRKSR